MFACTASGTADQYVLAKVKGLLAKTCDAIIVTVCSLSLSVHAVQLYYFLAVIISLSFGSLPESSQRFEQAAGFSAAVIVLWWVLCHLAARMVANSIANGELTEHTGYRWFDRQMECFRWLSLGLIFLCLGGFGLGRNLDQLPILEHSVALQSLVLLAPAVLVMLGLWTAERKFSRRFGWGEPGLIAAIKSIFSIARSSIGWLLIPIFAVMIVTDLSRLSPLPDLLPEWMTWVVLVAAGIASVPFLVRKVFPTIPMDPEAKQMIRSICQAAGVRHVKVVQWDTGNRIHNAMVAGILGRFRVVMVSDRLLKELSHSEIAMVILHEVAHVKRFHVPLRIVALLPAWCLGAFIQIAATRGEIVAALSPALQSGLQDWASTLGSIGSLIATVLVLRLVSYRSEFDADQFACKLAPKIAKTCPRVPETSEDAASHLATALLRVTPDGDSSRKASWLHPAINDRVDRLKDLSQQGRAHEADHTVTLATTTHLGC